jgi:hypothetical protein
MQNAPPVVRQHQKHMQDLEADGRHRKKVDGNLANTRPWEGAAGGVDEEGF